MQAIIQSKILMTVRDLELRFDSLKPLITRVYRKLKTAVDPVSDSYTENAINHRSKAVNILLKALGNEEQHREIAKKIEVEIYRCYNNVNYKNRLRAIAYNLRDIKNADLKVNILNGTIKPQKLAHMTNEEMATQEERKIRAEADQRALDSRRSDWFEQQKEGVDGMFTCEKCGSRQTEHA